MSKRMCLAIVVAIGLSDALIAQGVDLRPGKYDVTMEMNMADMPKMPPMKNEQCITAEDVANLASGKKLGDVDKIEMNCKVSWFKLSRNTATFGMTCDNGAWSGEMTFAGDTYTQVWTGKDREGHAMSGKVSAKRVGDCTK